MTAERERPLPARFAESIGQLVGPDFPDEIGLAVSGGGDSMAMLHLAAGWARVYGIALHVATVDHGLRPEAAAEAVLVADEARGLGLSHSTLNWSGWDGLGNLPDAARRARLDLIGRWRGTIRHILFAHTEDDQAETFLMRLKRGSGAEGLGAMKPVRRVSGPLGDWFVVRPMLEMRRAELRHYLKVLSIPYADDPTNNDATYDRVRMRGLLDRLESEGLSRTVLARTAARMQRAAAALGRRAQTAARESVTVAQGDVLIDRDGFAGIEPDTQLRLLAGALRFVSGAEYRPRMDALESALDRLLSGGAVTLSGCCLQATGETLRVFREYAAVKNMIVPAQESAAWDSRWKLSGPDLPGAEIRALGGGGLRDCAERRATGVPRQSLISSPSVWQGERLVAAPLAGLSNGWRAILAKGRDDFVTSLILH